MALKAFNLVSKELIEQVGHCELCGSRRNLEVHHIIPRVASIQGIDLDDEDNLIVVCGSCHSKLTPRRMLTKYGIAKLPVGGGSQGSKSLMMKFYKMIENKNFECDVEDLLDIVELVFADYLSEDDIRERKDRLGL